MTNNNGSGKSRPGKSRPGKNRPGKNQPSKGRRGNSQRPGAVKKSGKGNPTAGSGGRVRRGLEGKGPTPPAEDRPHHKAYRKPQSGRQQPSGRKFREDAAEWVTGRNAVAELLRAGVPVTAVRLAEGQVASPAGDDPIGEIFRLASDQGVSVAEAGRAELDSLAGGTRHQGVAAKVEAYRYADPEALVETAGEPPLIIALDGVTDPRNLGAVVRSASGFGAHGVVVPERRNARMTAAAWKASAGAAARVPVARATNLTRVLKAYKQAGLMVIGLAAGGEVPIQQCPVLDGPLVVVIGSEGTGLSRLVADTCDQLVSIPIASAEESLNASVAAGIVLYAASGSRAN